MSDRTGHVAASQILRILETDAEGAAQELVDEAETLEAKAKALRADAARVRAARAAAFPALQLVRDVPDHAEEVVG